MCYSPQALAAEALEAEALAAQWKEHAMAAEARARLPPDAVVRTLVGQIASVARQLQEAGEQAAAVDRLLVPGPADKLLASAERGGVGTPPPLDSAWWRLQRLVAALTCPGAAEEEDLKAGGRCSGHATPLQPRSRTSVGIILLREIELVLVQENDTSSSGPSTA